MFLRSFIVLAFFAKFLLPICDFNYEYVGMNYEIWMDGAISEYGEVLSPQRQCSKSVQIVLL